MKKRDKIIYWVATLWLALGMTSTGIVQLIGMQDEIDRTVDHLGFPVYFLTIIGIWKLLGVIAILVPKFSLIKEWAYAGFFFNMTGALYAHVAMGDPFSEMFPALLLLALTIVSWYFRPESRKLSLNFVK
ncbi:MAG: DoxX family protein [Cyclobacteriaceae bacterium]|nr:DoxX family protein [Cyclobacteriaceae bacterium SS2]